MSKRLFFGRNDIRFWFYRFKDSSYYSLSIILTIIIVCVLLLLNVVIPLANNYFSITQEVALQRERLDIVNKNIEFVNSLDKKELSEQFDTATKAVPIDKDFVAVLNALSDAAVNSGVVLSDFFFSVEDQKADETKSYIELTIRVNGSLSNVKDFIREINTKLPISETVNVNNKANITNIGIRFYYKSYPDIKFEEDKLLSPISESDKNLANKLSEWKRTSIVIPETTPSSPSTPATQSAQPLFE